MHETRIWRIGAILKELITHKITSLVNNTSLPALTLLGKGLKVLFNKSKGWKTAFSV